MQEIWKDITGFEGLYQVSNLGRIKSLKRNVKNAHSERIIKEKILKQSEGKKYMHVRLSKNCKTSTKLVHRLVAEAFISNFKKLKEVNHLDANPKNNCIDNLEWCSRYDNMQHAKKLGLIKHNKNEKCYWYNKYGKDHTCSKKIIQLNKKNEIIKEWDSLADVKRILNIPQSNICRCCQGKRKTAGGFKWQYLENY